MKTMQCVMLSVLVGVMTITVNAQQPQKVKKGYGVPVVQTQPEFPGGDDSLKAFIKANLKYPLELKESRAGGTVMIMFIIDTEGKVTDPMVMKGVNTPINEESLRIVKSMPAWKPGTAGGMPVNKQYTVTIDFVPPSI